MAFIDKKNPVVLNIKLTSKGRELLSQGNLSFDYFAIGDSEIDYNFSSNNLDSDPIFNSYILRPADKNPSLLSFIPKNLTGSTYNAITNVPSTPTIIQNTAVPLGFFTIGSGSTTFKTDTDHVKQPDVMIEISGVTGGTRLEVKQAPTYLANLNEPIAGDLILVKWTNPYGESTTGYTVNTDSPTPYLMYKIEGVEGTLDSNNLVLTVDRNLPDFTQPTGGTASVVAGAIIFYDYNNFTGNTAFSSYSTDYVDDAVLSFLTNCQSTVDTFPFWNMSIIYTEEIAGVQTSGRSYIDYSSRKYAGFVSYIQNQAPVYKKLGVIHYTNSSPANTYAEELYKNTPILDLPTVMWHKSTGNTMGVRLTAYGNMKYLTGATKSLNTAYYDLADPYGNVVGKIFNDLKLFVIEDQELLFALSYKANRSWTLPNYTVGINDNVVIGCLTSEIDFQLSASTLSSIGASDGQLLIYDIVNWVGQRILQVSGETVGQVYLNYVTGDTILYNLSGDTYNVKIFDTEAINTPTGKTITITSLSASTEYVFVLYSAITSQSGLNPEFTINKTASNGTQVRIYKDDIGTLYGTGTTTPAIGLAGYGNSTIGWYSTWTNVGGVEYITLNLSYTSPYTIYVRDVIDYGTPQTFTVSQDYVAVGSPFNTTFTASEDIENDGRQYMEISQYLTTINDSTNRIVGDIEFTAYKTNSNTRLPEVWESMDSGVAQGGVKKLYYTPSAYEQWTFVVREVYVANDGKKIEVARVSRNIFTEPL